MLSKESKNLTKASDAYRKRRGRHPPPGFAEWFAFAQDRDAVIIEEFFDQIYHDLTPFWGIDAARIRQLAKHFPVVISVRNGKAKLKTDKPRIWADLWHNMTATIEEWLPDVEIPINVMDESRVIVPWEMINTYANAERTSRVILSEDKILTKFTGLSSLDANPGQPIETKWIREGAFWDIARVGCAPDTPTREIATATDFSGPPPVLSGFPPGSFGGYVQNWTAAKNPCLQPELRESHGTFIEPVSISTTHSLFPIFGGSKLPMNNDILIPPAMYWSEDPIFKSEGNGGPWEKKTTKLIWRGGGTGGRNRDNNWTRFQRHRFVSMVNGTAVQLAEANRNGAGHGPNFILQSYNTYRLTATKYMDLGSWLNEITDVGFVHLTCFPSNGGPHCDYTDHYFEIKPNMKLQDQFRHKFLPDIDGNSFSGRYRSFLFSTSLPIKATIYAEWHDSRLTPWVHFVPMDNSFVDVYGILDYFIGTGVEFKYGNGTVLIEGAHDEAAKRIAMAGKEWAEKVLRKEDMLIYYMRLLMEYARVSDDQRERLAFVDDLK